MKSSNIGGQAVIEGIMMKNGDDYAVAVRKPDQEIEIKKDSYTGFTKGKKILALPFIRGVFNFIDSMVLGMKTLTYSATFYEEEEEKDDAKPKTQEELDKESAKKEKRDKIMMGCTVAVSICLAVAIFLVAPVYIADIFRRFIPSHTVMSLIEGLIRIGIFVLYVTLIAQMKDIKRVFMYHGAEHKCINCIEHGLDLTVENVRKSSKQHKRCGTSFMLFVMVVSIILFIFLPKMALLPRVISRILLIPVIAGISYEFIKLAGRSESPVVNMLSKPGLWLQNLTTKEPDDDMIEVGIASVEAVFDWKAYETENFGKVYPQEDDV